MRNLIVAASFVSLSALASPCWDALKSLRANPHQGELARYEATRILELSPTQDIKGFRPQTGFEVLERNGEGNATRARLRVLSDNPGNRIQILSELNGWGADLRPEDELRPVPGTPYFEGEVRVRHGMEYRLLLNGRQVLDPAADTYSTAELNEAAGKSGYPYLNSLFWDFDRPGAYRSQAPVVDLRGKPAVIAETEIFALVEKWKGGPARKADTYRFIAESGVIDQLKNMGYNAVEFLPFTASIDGSSWHLRYQVFGNGGPDSRFGSPDDFARMTDAFNKAGVAVIMDAVVGHFPMKGNEGIRDLAPVGLHQWKKTDGQNLYGSVWSPWGTYRYDYANPFVRKFLIDNILRMMSRYGISGIRVDNLDGIRFYEGPGGGGPEFLREMAEAVRAHRPEALLIGEMFFGESKVMASQDKGGIGFGLRTHSDLFDFFKDNLKKRTEEIDMWALRSSLRNPWSWGEATRLQYPTNHDEAANQRDGATGAYVATLTNGGGWNYVEGKTRAFGALAMLSGTAYLDMPQMRLLQEGTFYTNPAVDWSLLQHQSQRQVNDFFSSLSKVVAAEPAFAHQNLHPEIENHSDYDNKIVSLERIDHATGKRVYALVNLGHQAFDNYAFGVMNGGEYRILTDTDRPEFGGSGELARRAPGATVQAQGHGTHGKPHTLVAPYLPPYGVIVFASP
jgi:1,4-alpha-glucan branching enzyme